MTRRLGLLLVLVGCWLLAPDGASAHARLEKADPPVGSAGPAPARMTLRFSEAIELRFSGVILTRKTGEALPVALMMAPDDARRLEIIPTDPLVPGDYDLAWHIVSVDTHKTSGHFTLTVTSP